MATGPLITIVGPTASGKSAMAMGLASKLNGEIICADSRTIYKGMDIGTAKPSKQDQQHVPHHLIDVIEPSEPYTVVDFQKQATQIIKDIHKRGRIPFLVGGSGMYVDSILFSYSFADQNMARDPANPRHMLSNGLRADRVIRDDTLIIGIDVPTEELESRIRLRIEKMLDRGLIDEARQLVGLYGWDKEAMKTYLPLRGYMEGSEQIKEASQKMFIKDRQLAKKQKTWFKRNKSIHWIKSPQEAIEITTDFLNNQS